MEKLKRAVVRSVLPMYTRRELPGWGRLYSRWVGSYENDAFWAGARPAQIRGKLHGYEMRLDLAKWSERATFFLGRFYDLPTQLLLSKVLSTGDRVLDVGANIGMISLLASRLVGTSGRVDAFEPNPECRSRVADSIGRNQINNIFVHPFALSDCESSMQLHVKPQNSGESTLGQLQEDERDDFTVAFAVDVRRGDDVVASATPPPMLIKIYVEGFECKVLSGLTQTLNEIRPLVLTEVVASHLERSGDSLDRLFDQMEEHGYQPFGLSTQRRALRHHLKLDRIQGNRGQHHDVAWIHPQSPAVERLGDLIV